MPEADCLIKFQILFLVLLTNLNFSKNLPFMNKELAGRIVANFKNIDLNDTKVIDDAITSLKEDGMWDSISETKLKVFVACMKHSENESKANELLISLIPKASIEDLQTIFRKVSTYNEIFVEYCKKYSRIKKLRPIIVGIFTKLKIVYEKTHIYPQNVKISDENVIKRLLETLNSYEFKQTKSAIARLDLIQNKHLLPKLTEFGIRNFRSICGLNFSLFFILTPNHESEIIRVEYFKTVKDMEQITEFLMINQFLNEDINRVEIAESFKTKLYGLRIQANFNDSVNKLYCKILYPMCKSQNLARRRFGSLLLFNTIEFLDHTSQFKEIINGLVYDKNHVIRQSASKYCKMIDKDIFELISELKDTKSYKIIGASEFLKNCNPIEVFACFESDFEDKKMPSFGFLYYFNSINFCSKEYSKIVDKIFSESKFEVLADPNDWKILREILVFYYHNDQVDIPINVMLKTDHLGLICFLKNMIDLTKISEPCLKKYIDLGLAQIKEKGNIIRKSGGLSEYFVLLVKNRKNYLRVKEALFNIICRNSSSIEIERCLPEATIIHALNAFIAILNENAHDDLEFYFRLGFECFNNALFSIKNCGCSILSSIFKKQLLIQKDFDSLFLSYHGIRSYLLEMLEYSISALNSLSVYFILFILSRINDLTNREIHLIEQCKNFGGLTHLKVMEILKFKPEKSEDTKLILKFGEKQEEKSILLRILLIYNTNDTVAKDAAKIYLEKHYNFPVVSYEYSVHLLTKLIRNKGYNAFVEERLIELDSDLTNLSSKSNMFDECPCNEDGDMPYLIS